MSRVTVFLVITIGSPAVREQNHHLMDGFGVLGEVIPECIGVFQVGLGVAFLGVDEVGEFGGVADEEDL